MKQTIRKDVEDKDLTIEQKKILSAYLDREDKLNNSDYINGYDEGETNEGNEHGH